MSETTPFSLVAPRYSDDTYWGRLQHYLDVTDFRTLFVTKKELNDVHLKRLKDFEQGKRDPCVTDADLWYSRKVRDSMVHPDTKEVIPRPFRMAGYVPYGTPIVVFVLMPATANSFFLTGLSQSVNQSHNALVNYSNRSAKPGAPDNKGDVFKGFVGAVTAALTISLSSLALVNRAKVSERTRYLMKLAVPWPSVACASTTNMLVMRQKELWEGVQVRDADTGEEMGISCKAARRALEDTAWVRVTLASIVSVVPQILFLSAQSTGLLTRYPRLSLPLQSLFALTVFGLGVPMSLALFTQQSEIEASCLEPEFLTKKNSMGVVPQRYVFNKGM